MSLFSRFILNLLIIHFTVAVVEVERDLDVLNYLYSDSVGWLSF